MYNKLKEILDRIDKLSKRDKNGNEQVAPIKQSNPFVEGKFYYLGEVVALSKTGKVVKNLNNAEYVHVIMHSKQDKNSTEYYVAPPKEIKKIQKKSERKELSDLAGEEVTLFMIKKERSKIGLHYINTVDEFGIILSQYTGEISKKEFAVYVDFAHVDEAFPCNNKKQRSDFKKAKFIGFKYRCQGNRGYSEKEHEGYISAEKFKERFGKLDKEIVGSLANKPYKISKDGKTSAMLDIHPF